MKGTARPGAVSSLLLALAGVAVGGIGVYFIFLRPSLLPEDIRFMQLSAGEVAAIGPRLQAWHAQVFRVMGGYALGTGLLTVALAATSFRSRRPIAVAGAILGGAASIGLMAFVNFTIDSDFKWFLLSCAVLWALSLVAFCIEEWVARAAIAHAHRPEVARAFPISGKTEHETS